MPDVIWIAVFLAVTAAGTAIVVARRSRAWIIAGVAYVLGGIGFATYNVIHLTGAFDPPAEGAAVDIAVWFGVVGFLSLLAGTLLTLIAIGRRGRRRFLVVVAAATLTITTYQFWTTNWAARFGDVPTGCADAGHPLSLKASVQRVPPGLRCPDRGRNVFVPADSVAWLALAGWSVFYGFAASFPVMGLAWVARRQPTLSLPRARAEG